MHELSLHQTSIARVSCSRGVVQTVPLHSGELEQPDFLQIIETIDSSLSPDIGTRVLTHLHSASLFQKCQKKIGTDVYDFNDEGSSIALYITDDKSRPVKIVEASLASTSVVSGAKKYITNGDIAGAFFVYVNDPNEAKLLFVGKNSKIKTRVLDCFAINNIIAKVGFADMPLDLATIIAKGGAAAAIMQNHLSEERCLLGQRLAA